MCRLAAFPPGFPRNKALEILARFEGGNTDGTGSAFVRDGQFIIQKWPKAFSWVMKKGKPFLSHMPHDGWTIVHLRAGSHGRPCPENTHPFVAGPWAFIHNGIWRDHKLVKLALSKTCSFYGDTDSEVAANLWNVAGPQAFTNEVDWGGVFLALKQNGDLWVSKTSGDLEFSLFEDQKILMASDLDKTKFEHVMDGLQGWYHFGPDGKHISHHEKRDGCWHVNYPYRSSAELFRAAGLLSAKETKEIAAETPTSVPVNQADFLGCSYKGKVREMNERYFDQMGDY